MPLRRNERLEYLVQFFWINTWAGVFNGDNNLVALMRSSHLQCSKTILHSVHCFDSVAYQVDDDLLQLALMTCNKWQFRRQLDARRNLVIRQICAQTLKSPDNHIIHIKRIDFLLPSPKQGAQVVEYFAGTTLRWHLTPKPLKAVAPHAKSKPPLLPNSSAYFVVHVEA